MAETDSLTVIKNAVLDGMGMTILPVSAVISELDHDLMLAQEIVSPTVTCTVALCSPKSMTISHAAECVARLIVAVGPEICAIGRGPGAPVQDDHSETAQ